MEQLLRCQFLGFAFLPHHLQRALGFLVRLRDFLLYLGSGLFHLWREANVAVVLHAGAGRDEASHDDVLFQTAQVVHRSVDGGFGENARGLLERRRGDERIRGERCFRDAQEQRTARGRLASLRNHPLVLFAEAELINLLLQQERSVAHVFDLHPAHHLADDHFNVLVRDVHALQAIDFLDFVHQVSLEFLFAQHGKNVMRVERAIHERLAGLDAFAFLHVNVHAARYRVLFFGAIVGLHVKFALTFRNLAELDRAINLADDGGLMRLAGLEQFNDARQTTGDVFGLGGLTRNLRQHIARMNGVAVGNHQVSARRHQVALAALALDHQSRLALLVGRIAHNVTRQSGDFVHFFVQGNAFLQIFELDRAADFGNDGEGIRVPLDHHLAKVYRIAIVHLYLGAVNHSVTFALAALVVNNRNGSLTIHDNQIAGLGFYRLQSDEADRAVVFGIKTRLFGNSRCRTADVEGTHRKLRSRFTDGLRRDHAGCLAQFHQTSGSQVAAVAHDANAALGFAGEHGTDLYPLNARRLHRHGEFFGDFLVDVHDHLAVVVFQFFQRDAAHDAVAQRFDNLARFHDARDENSVHRTAVVFADDHILRHVHQTAGQVAGIGGLECRISQTFTSAVGRDEVLQHRQPFAEVRGDRRLDNFAGRFRHQAAHAGELANLLFRSASAGVGHDVNRVDDAFFILPLHLTEHFVGHFFRDARPDFDDLVVTFAVGDGAVQVLLLDCDYLLFGFLHNDLLVVRNDHVINADGETRARRKAEAEVLNSVEHLHGDFQAKAQIAVIHQLANTFFLQQAVDERHALGQVIVQDRAAHGRVQEPAIHVDRLGVRNVLIVVGLGQINYFAGVT